MRQHDSADDTGFAAGFADLAGFGVVAVVVVGMLAGGCVKIAGGAVELSWVVRSNTGAAITDCSCADPAIPTVRLILVGDGGSLTGSMPCAGQAQCDFPCQRQTGSTGFDIPPTGPGETYDIKVVAVDSTGTEIPDDLVGTPAQISRSVVVGQPTELEAFELVAHCSTACTTMNGSGVCARP